MKVKLLSFVLLLSGFILQAQEVEKKEKKETVQFSEVLQPPLAPNCDANENVQERKKCTQKFIQKHLIKNFDADLAKKVAKGRIKIDVDFVIDSQGKPTKVVAQGGPRILNQNVIKIINELPILKPATKDGKPINVAFSVPLRLEVAQ